MRWMSARNEYSIFIDDAKRQRILHGLLTTTMPVAPPR
jgi:hypothetical protein